MKCGFDSDEIRWQGSRPIRPGPPPRLLNSKAQTVANPELGAKQICPNCQAKFYDLNRRPAHCPKCDTEFEAEEAIRLRRGRARPGVVEDDQTDEDEETDDQVKSKPKTSADDDEDEEEAEPATPEIDEAANEIPAGDDDDDDDGADKAAPGMGDADDDEEVSDDEDDSVPFLEDDDDEDFDDEIDGINDEDDED